MRTDTPPTIRLEDYRPPSHWIDAVHLDFQLDPAKTKVTSRLEIRRNESPTGKDLVLHGEALELISVHLDGAQLTEGQFKATDKTLTIMGPPDRFTLEIVNTCAPEQNTALSGLYMSKGMFCTQCEAEGFRRITYFLDRPDVLSVFSVRIEAEKSAYPVLLANGNPTGAGDLDGGAHFAEWHDPHPKPAYLFALVGGDLAVVEDQFTTQSGRSVDLKVYVQPQNADKCDYTLDALKRSMRWDEEVFGREYDLDLFMIVAVDHFNFGAMENKGLNIFNSAYVLASPETATDADYENIESIVAHEYFHNWSGNRVTLRDWFQLCLKEGFTVFRDQEFSADMRSRAVQRIRDVRRLWASQFPEDAGPLAHPPRPSEYVTIDNFYTATVYEKGAEVVRMIMTLLGPEKFRQGSDLYFQRHDGSAATVEDFVKAMEDASGKDLTQFRLWYHEAGRPKVTARIGQEGDRKRPTLVLSQRTPPTPGQTDKPARAIPFSYAVFGAESGELLAEHIVDFNTEDHTIDLPQPDQETHGRPVLSLNRGFAAPIDLAFERSLEDDLLILRAETDLFSKWAVSDRLWKDLSLALGDIQPLSDPSITTDNALDRFAAALDAYLSSPTLDHAFAAELLTVPSAAEIAETQAVIDPGAIVTGRRKLRAVMSARLSGRLETLYDELQDGAAFSTDPASAARRGLKNACLSLLIAGGNAELAVRQAATATTMTDEAAAVSALAASSAQGRDEALSAFYAKWRDNELIVNKWLAWRAMTPDADALDQLAALEAHESFDIKTPNKVRALIGVFAYRNLAAFHREDGAGYEYLAEKIREIDPLNPQLAARLSTAFESWRRLEPGRRPLAERALKTLVEGHDPSENVNEMATRLLSDQG